MILTKLKLKNFRRFAGAHTLDLSDDLIALVGPNEAGKSSILDALRMIGDWRVPDPRDLTRGSSEKASVRALMVLTDEDRDAIAGIPGGDQVTHVWVWFEAGEDQPLWEVVPRPSRDLGPRAHVGEMLEWLKAGDLAVVEGHTVEGAPPWEPGRIEEALAVATSREDRLSSAECARLAELAAALENLSLPDVEAAPDPWKDEGRRVQANSQRTETVQALRLLAESEATPAPLDQVIEELMSRRPAITYFGEVERELHEEYALDEIVGSPPPALANLCSMAGLDLARVRELLASGDRPAIEGAFETANQRLRQRFLGAWRQSDVYPRLAPPHDGALRIMVSTGDAGGYSYPSERSDGLRWFMALHAFLEAHGTRQPILLVDEAETHLHYDAQADLVAALMQQRITSKVIYTTHSVGCLPPDLGSGIRVVLTKGSPTRSTIANSYWSVDAGSDYKVGYEPLLFGMGARLLSLTIPEMGIVVEGPADAVLLPTLLREATGLSALPYRFVPGLSEIAEKHVPVLARSAGAVVHLTDADAGGSDIAAKLKHGGVDPARIFDLSLVRPECTLEDLVDRGVLLSAINREVSEWANGSAFEEAAGDLPDVGRWGYLQDKYGGESRFDRLSKVRIAQRVVDAGRGDIGKRVRVLDVDAIDGLRTLHTQMELQLHGV